MYYLVGVGQVTSIARGKTEHRIAQVVNILKTASKPLSYDEIRVMTGAVKQPNTTWRGGMAYDTLLYVTATLIEVDLLERIDVPRGVGRPRVFFVWKANQRAQAKAARDMGSRISA